jgi:hypothetical protein
VSKPRTPEYFPRMNDRAGRRRARRTAAREQPLTLSHFLSDLAAACARIVDTFTYAMRGRTPSKSNISQALTPAFARRGLTNTLATRADTMLSARRSPEEA